LPVEPYHHEKHPAEQGNSGCNGKNTIHGEGLNGIGVRCYPVEKIPDLSSTVEGQGEALEVAVEVTAKVIDHALPDPDGAVVVQHGQPAQKEIDQYQAYAGNEENGLLWEGFQKCPGDRLSTQHIIDDDLERPRFQDFEHTNHKNLPQSYYERETVGPEVFEDLSSHGGTSPFNECKMGRRIRNVAEHPAATSQRTTSVTSIECLQTFAWDHSMLLVISSDSEKSCRPASGMDKSA
jgi:hypothetical protein